MGNNIIFLGLENFVHATLAEIGTMVGLSYDAYSMHNVQDDVSFDILQYRVKQAGDCFLGYLDWLRRAELGNFAYTLSGQSMRAFRHRFMRHKLLIHNNADVLSMERQSFYGGQCSAFRTGKQQGEFYELDVNGLYPHVMRYNIFPVRLTAHYKMPERLYWQDMDVMSRSIARVEIDSDKRYYPVRANGGVVYRKGKFVTTLTGPELVKALVNSDIKTVGEVATYDCEVCFRDFVDFFWGERLRFKVELNTVMARVCKHMLVALYGKFGQHGIRWQEANDVISEEDCGQWYEVNADTGQIVTRRNLFGAVEQRGSEQETSTSMPAIAAFIAAYGRMEMDYWRKVAGQFNCVLQYVDSLIVTKEGMDRIFHHSLSGSNTLGKMSLRSASNGIEVVSPQQYVWQGKPKICGLKLGSELLDTNTYAVWQRSPASELGDLNGIPALTEERIIKCYQGGPEPIA